MNLYKHVVEQPFIFATGIAALVHSTWSLGTLFSGEQPQAGLSIEFAGWILPAFFCAFALDVGQIATSAEIRKGHRTKAKYATFAIFALATYYLQWLYIAHHMPYLELGGGVRGEWSGMATLIRDAAVWIIPAFLPLSTLMYTFSSDHARHDVSPEPIVEPENAHSLPQIEMIKVEKPQPEQLPDVIEENAELASDLPADSVEVSCGACGWKGSYKTEKSAKYGLATHQSRHCTARFPAVHTNGNGPHK